MSAPVVVAESLSYAYGSHRALDNVEFSIPSGTLFGLLGPNGSGKSTLFRLLSTLISVQTGRLLVCGLDVAKQRSAVRRRIGVTFQSPAVDVRLTVLENLKCHGSLYSIPGRELTLRIGELLERFQLTDRSATVVGQLSGGLKRRVELAKGLLHRPQVLLLDEPTSGLDPGARQNFWDLVKCLSERERTTVLVATHLMSEAELCDQLLLLNEGQRVALGTPDELQAGLRGDQLTLRLKEPNMVRSEVELLLQCKATLAGDRLTLRVSEPAAQISRVISHFGDQLIGLELTRPSLEDVFLNLTGHSLASSGADDE